MQDETILVVDDETANLQKLRRTFINLYPVLAAANGREALELVKTHPEIAVIVADQKMPEMTGIELLSASLQYLPHAVRIILTGFTEVEVLMSAINSCRVFRYIVKPWDPPDLLMAVQRGLESQRLAVENERFRKELVRRERLARELEIAREIQRYILPIQCPEMEDFELAVRYQPALEVGGDLYDFEVGPGGDFSQIAIGDVSGKSIPAALYGAVFSGYLRTVFSESRSPGEILSFLNAMLLARYRVSNYIALCYCRCNLKTGEAEIANAGMPFPYWIHSGEVTRISISGVPLGLMEGLVYDEVRIGLAKGDTLIFASDGTTDIVDAEGRMYDRERFMECIRRNASLGLPDLASVLQREICEFTGNTELSDDLTILAFRRRA